ncbi:Uncharacterised protein [Mycobacteroides abscessus subsp. abscessus]|uniref:hypothetical protein n=1 Tax=Mycobacteroides abscessus TaxID=36809 RepID=UPI000927CC8B|nr:hypothetical protein [Mycobacteroides abscessus]SIH23710.1 Uncharacterised protein [Mycobacteroides abscessus subsp. abscessus]
MSDTPSTGNRRVDALLECAVRHGLTVDKSQHVERCWTIHGDNGHSLTVYDARNDTARVTRDLPGQQNMIKVPQRHARYLMATGALLLEDTRRAVAEKNRTGVQ